MVWVGRSLKDPLTPTPCHGQGRLPPDHRKAVLKDTKAKLRRGLNPSRASNLKSCVIYSHKETRLSSDWEISWADWSREIALALSRGSKFGLILPCSPGLIPFWNQPRESQLNYFTHEAVQYCLPRDIQPRIKIGEWNRRTFSEWWALPQRNRDFIHCRQRFIDFVNLVHSRELFGFIYL